MAVKFAHMKWKDGQLINLISLVTDSSKYILYIYTDSVCDYK